jgi:hypothetical protein
MIQENCIDTKALGESAITIPRFSFFDSYVLTYIHLKQCFDRGRGRYRSPRKSIRDSDPDPDPDGSAMGCFQNEAAAGAFKDLGLSPINKNTE